MGDFFEVELDTLATYVTTLKSAQDHLSELPKLVSGNGTDLGNDRLNSAAGDFQDKWKSGAEDLGDLVSGTTDAVSEIHKAYSTADRGAESIMRTLQEPLQMPTTGQ